MTTRTRTILGVAALLLLASCGDSDADVVENAPANLPDAPNAAETAIEIANAVAANAADNATGAEPATAAVSLARYVGKQPSEPVGGTSFKRDPAVTAAVAALVPDAKVRAFISGSTGPESAIALKDGRLLAWGCQVHNCGPHNWSVTIAPDGSRAEVCHYDETDAVAGQATWYVAPGRSERRTGSCPSE